MAAIDAGPVVVTHAGTGPVPDVDLSVDLAGVTFPNPIFTGPFSSDFSIASAAVSSSTAATARSTSTITLAKKSSRKSQWMVG